MKEIEQINRLTQEIIIAAKDVHRTLGPGLAEADYRKHLSESLTTQGLKVEFQPPTPGAVQDEDCEIDLLVDDKVMLMIKSDAELTQQQQSQLTSCLVQFGYEVGLLINFNVENMEQGIRRVINAELYGL